MYQYRAELWLRNTEPMGQYTVIQWFDTFVEKLQPDDDTIFTVTSVSFALGANKPYQSTYH
jgi:hypothetical protein